MSGKDIFELLHEKTNHLGFRPGPTYTRRHMQSQKIVEALDFGFRKKRHCTDYGAETKVLITAKLICVFALAYAHCLFSDAADHLN